MSEEFVDYHYSLISRLLRVRLERIKLFNPQMPFPPIRFENSKQCAIKNKDSFLFSFFNFTSERLKQVCQKNIFTPEVTFMCFEMAREKRKSSELKIEYLSWIITFWLENSLLE